MQVFVTVLSNRILRITDGRGAFLSADISKAEARILSVVVPENVEDKTVARNLLLAAEKILLLKGKKKIIADFSDGYKGAKELFESAGYDFLSATDILAVPMGVVLYSPNVKKALEKGNRSAKYVPFSELNIIQLEEVFKLLDQVGIPVSCYDMAHYNRNVSAVVFDDEGSPLSVILCTEVERDLHVNVLVSKAFDDPGILMTTMVGMVECLKECGGEKRYNRLTMAAYNSKLDVLLRKTLAEEPGIEVIGQGISMIKNIKEKRTDYKDYKYQEKRDDYQETAWEREAGRIPYQKNILLKAQWHREKDSR